MRITMLLATCLFFATPLKASDWTDRGQGPDEAQMLARGATAPAKGMAFFRPVLAGVLYRAGFKGGDKGRTGLDDGQRRALCEAGFSRAFYADFGRKTRYGEPRCDAGTLDYQAARSTRPKPVMKAIHDIIKDPASGPAVVHCMWGVHSSGALSAMALVQFCGWSEDRAKAYWQSARNKAPCSGGCGKWIDAKFEAFEIDPSLAISDSERAAICPQ